MNNKKEGISFFVAVVSALIASSCCWLPLVLIAFGAGSAVAVVAYIEPYRIPISIVALCALAVAFYYIYKKPAAVVEDCCSVEGKGVKVVKKLNKVILWIVTLIVLCMLFFPETLFSFLTGQKSSTATNNSNIINSTDDKTETVTIHIEGMT
ncbi:MAG: hypothetical protein HY606_12650 [Planctomycetes bacterium]|nr:hypothetical protein [Planctomycetota bacterium]